VDIDVVDALERPLRRGDGLRELGTFEDLRRLLQHEAMR